MLDPYKVFSLTPDASEAAVRARYLELVREFSPDRDPTRFAEIRAAYEVLRDPLRGLERKLFHLEVNDSLGAFAADLRRQVCTARIPYPALLAMAESP